MTGPKRKMTNNPYNLFPDPNHRHQNFDVKLVTMKRLLSGYFRTTRREGSVVGCLVRGHLPVVRKKRMHDRNSTE